MAVLSRGPVIKLPSSSNMSIHGASIVAASASARKASTAHFALLTRCMSPHLVCAISPPFVSLSFSLSLSPTHTHSLSFSSRRDCLRTTHFPIMDLFVSMIFLVRHMDRQFSLTLSPAPSLVLTPLSHSLSLFSPSIILFLTSALTSHSTLAAT